MLTEDQIREALREVIDPEVGINVVDMGLVYRVTVGKTDQRVEVEMTLTSPMCPAGPQIVQAVRHTLESIEGVGAVHIEMVWSPPWSPEMMSEDAKDELGIF